MRDMFLLMSSAQVMGLSYHRWLYLVAALFLVLCALNAGIQYPQGSKTLLRLMKGRNRSGKVWSASFHDQVGDMMVVFGHVQA